MFRWRRHAVPVQVPGKDEGGPQWKMILQPLAEGKLDDKISKIIEQEAEDVVLGLKS